MSATILSRLCGPLSRAAVSSSIQPTNILAVSQVLMHPDVMAVRHKGHSKWQNIKATKEANDAHKSKISGKYSYMVSSAIRSNGGETRLDYNRELERVFKAGLSEGVMKATLERAIKRYGDMSDISEHLLEIRGPGNSFILVEMLAKSLAGAKNEIGKITRKKGGMLDSGMANMFEHRGQIIAKPPADVAGSYSNDTAEEDAIEVGAEEAEFDSESGVVEFLCSRNDFSDVKTQIEEKKFEVVLAKIGYIPTQYIELTTDREIDAFTKLIEALEAEDKCTAVHHNVSS